MGLQLGKARVAPLALLGLCFALVVKSVPLADAGPHVNYGWGEPIRFRHLYTASRHGPFSYFLRIHGDGRVDGAVSQSRHSLLEIRAVALRTVAIKGVHSSRYLCMEEEGRLHGLVVLDYWELGPLPTGKNDRMALSLTNYCAKVALATWNRPDMCNVSGPRFASDLSGMPGANLPKPIYTTEDCSFEEEIRPDGYNVYKSKKYGILVSLSNARQRQQYKGKDFLPLSHFLPMMNTVPVETTGFGEYGDTRQYLESGIFNQPVETDSMDPFGITSEVSLVQSPSFG